MGKQRKNNQSTVCSVGKIIGVDGEEREGLQGGRGRPVAVDSRKKGIVSETSINLAVRLCRLGGLTGGEQPSAFRLEERGRIKS